MGNLPHASDSHRHSLEGLSKLAAAREALDAILAGGWEPDDDVMSALEELLRQARHRFRWAAMTANPKRRSVA